MRSVSVFEGQTIYDIAIQEYGCFEAVFLLLEDNVGLTLDTELINKQQLNIRNEVPELTETNKQIVEIFKQKNIKPNSGYQPDLTQGDFELEDFEQIDFL